MAACTWYGPDGAGTQRRLDQRLALRDLGAIPAGAVLLLEQHEIAFGRDPRLAPRVVQEHEGEQPGDLGVLGEAGVHEPGETDRLAAQVVAFEVVARGRGVALVEDQVETRQNAGEALLEQGRRRNAERDPGFEDLALGAHDALRERRLADDEGAGQLRRVETGDRLQRQRDPRLDRQRRVAAGEQQAEPVVVDRRRRGAGRDRAVVVVVTLALQARDLAGEIRVAAQPVERLAPGGRRDPRGGFGGNAARRPRLERDRERVLRRVLRQREVAEPPGETGDDPSPLDPHRALDLRMDDRLGSVVSRAPRATARFCSPGGPAANRPHMAE